MILQYKDDLSAFREAVRAWIRQTAPPEKSHVWRGAKGADLVEIEKWWMKERAKVGLATPCWPKEYGGAGLGLAHQIVIADEFARGMTPASQCFVIGLNHLPATLLQFGSEAQKAAFLPTVAQGTIWCQGFSEPGAGSDLAALKTKAVLNGDHYVINGQKIWSSYAMYARYAILLARTSSEGKKQQGITYFILDMKSPGIEVRPIRKSTGSSDFSELFLTDVRVPMECRVGEENDGWAVAQATLASERGVLAFEATEREHVRITEFYSSALAEDASWLRDQVLRREFMQFFAEHQALRRQIRGLLQEADHSEGWSMTPALVKLTRSTLLNRFGELRVKVAGLQGQTIPAGASLRSPMYEYLDSFGATIAAGSNEIMRNLIAERGLRMPR